jgi:hypothetical protein
MIDPLRRGFFLNTLLRDLTSSGQLRLLRRNFEDINPAYVATLRSQQMLQCLFQSIAGKRKREARANNADRKPVVSMGRSHRLPLPPKDSSNAPAAVPNGCLASLCDALFKRGLIWSPKALVGHGRVEQQIAASPVGRSAPFLNRLFEKLSLSSRPDVFLLSLY